MMREENTGTDDSDAAGLFHLWLELLSRCRVAHRRKDKDELERIYSFAAWSLSQEDKEVWNAAGVYFYEHIVEDEVAFREHHQWVARDVFEQTCLLLYERISIEKYEELCAKHGLNAADYLPQQKSAPSDDSYPTI